MVVVDDDRGCFRFALAWQWNGRKYEMDSQSLFSGTAG